MISIGALLTPACDVMPAGTKRRYLSTLLTDENPLSCRVHNAPDTNNF